MKILCDMTIWLLMHGDLIKQGELPNKVIGEVYNHTYHGESDKPAWLAA